VTERRRFRPYPKYKDSGVEWLGEIPAQWKIKRLKYLAPVSNERSGEAAFKLPFLGLEHIESGTGRLISENQDIDNNEPEVEEVGSIFRPGDVLFGKLRPYLAKVFLPDRNGRCSTEFLVLRSIGEISPHYLAYQLLSPGFIRLINAMTYGTKMPRANPEHVTNVGITLGRLDEQDAIASFLDRETAKIDTLIEKKKRLIELLQEKRTALITQAVTKGLNPNVPKKDSGVEWLGEIPAHWEVKRLKHVGLAIIGLTYEPADVVAPDEGVLVLRASNVCDGHIVLEDKVFVKRAIPDCLITRVGDILICSRSGSRSLIGKNAKIDKALVGLTFGTFMTVFRSIYNDYLFYAFNSTLFSYQSGVFLTSTINQLTIYNLNNLTVPVPPHDERSVIIAFLDRETVKIDALLAKIREAIDRLKEYRTALISAAVTGKIDVRGEAIQ
jgi:type I restriction enzyme S subunit